MKNLMITVSSLALATLLAGSTLAAQGPGGFGGAERKLVEQFDADKNGRLNAVERAAARASLPAQGAGGRGGGGRGGFAPPPGGAPPGGGFGGGGFGGGGRGGGGGGAAMVASTPGAQIAPNSVPRVAASVNFYAPTALRTVFLQFENTTDWEAELAAFNNTDVEVPATATVDGQVYRDVGVHFRGASSFSMVPAGSKRSLALDFQFVNETQLLNGYKSFNFLNAMNDPTFTRAPLYSLIAREYIAAPKVNHVRVVINGEDWGVYVNAQQFNKDMLREFFPSNEDGARWTVPGSPGGRGGLEYLGEDPAAYKATYEIKTNDSAADWTRFIAMTRILNQTPPAQLEAALAPYMDVNQVLRFMALDVALANSDGYWTRASDYNIYMDERGIFRLIPHDMNEALGVGGSSATLNPLVAANDPSKALHNKLLAVPALRARYISYVKEIAQKNLDWTWAGPHVTAWQNLIRQNVMDDNRKLYSDEAFTTGVDSLRNWMQQRRDFLLAWTPPA